MFLIISQDFKPKQKKGQNNKDASRWDGEDTQPAYSTFAWMRFFFLFNKGHVLSQSCNRKKKKKKKMDAPLGENFCKKSEWLKKASDSRKDFVNASQKVLPHWGERMKMCNFEGRESIACLIFLEKHVSS